MQTQPRSNILARHPDPGYYEAWATMHHIDLTKYPFIKMDYDPSMTRLIPFAVWDFDILKTEEGHKVGMIEVWYKSIFTKHSFRVVIYI